MPIDTTASLRIPRTRQRQSRTNNTEREVKRILVAYDGSAPARRALAHAAEFAQPGDSLTIVNVMPEPGLSAWMAPPTKERSRQRQLLDEAQRFMAERASSRRHRHRWVTRPPRFSRQRNGSART